MQKTKFKIQGIKCSNCSLLIEEKLKNKEGVVKIKVDQTSNKGVVIYDEQKITEQDIYQTIENINDFHLERIKEIVQPAGDALSMADNKEQDLGIKKVKFSIKGLKCDNCVLLIESRLENKEGVVKIKVDKTSNKGVVIYDKQKINEGDIYRTIEEIGGFKVEKLEDAAKSNEENVSYENPDESKEIKPPIQDSNNRGAHAFIAIAAILFLLFTFLPKNNQGSQINGSVNNIQAEAQQIDNQQIKASKTLEKRDSPVLEAYIVSRCPFGLQMQRIMADVVKNIPSLADNIKVRYMGNVSNGIISSMHGNTEAQENLRQICLREEQPAIYWSYVSCQMKSGDTSGCEAPSGVDSSRLSVCVSDNNRGLAYAKKDFDLNSKYQIQGSPTLILNGQQVSEFDFGGRTSDAVKNVICSGFNNQPGVCSAKLTTTNAATSFSATY